jgi:hypothetical protein
MKLHLIKNLIGTGAVAALNLWLAACASTSDVAYSNSDVDTALRTAGFRAKPAVTVEQRHQLQNLPERQFTIVQQGGDTYYLYPDKVNGRLYAGNHWAYRAFVNNEKNNQLRRAGALVFERDPSNRADNRTVVIWHDWTPFQQWE